MGLDIVQPFEQVRRGERRREHRRSIGILPPGWTQGRAGNYRRLRENVDIIHFERGNRLVENLPGSADKWMGLV